MFARISFKNCRLRFQPTGNISFSEKYTRCEGFIL